MKIVIKLKVNATNAQREVKSHLEQRDDEIHHSDTDSRLYPSSVN